MNLLAVSLAFPPLAYPRSIQVARLLAHTDASVALFCAHERNARLDQTIEPLAESRLASCIRIPVPNGKVDGYIDSLTHRFARGIWGRRNLMPDKYRPWRKAVIQAVLRYVETTELKPDAIVTFAQPFSSHLIGLELRSRLRLPWLAHFSDPWVDNPFSPFDTSSRNANLELEGSVTENADVLAFTSSETIELYFGKYPGHLRKKARLLPQSFDPDLFRGGKSSRPEKITIRYVGNFYGDRTPRPLISALKELDQRSPEILRGVSFELIGAGDAEQVARLAPGLAPGLITTRTSVPYSESLDLMMTADGLMVIDAPARLSVFLPSKLIDYIGAGRPILGITPPGAADKLIREMGGFVADPSDSGEIVNMLELFILELRKRRGTPKPFPDANTRIRDRYAIKQVASDFDSILRKMITNSRLI